jgi:alginate O-acetyltransferase complex protein AlgI
MLSTDPQFYFCAAAIFVAFYASRTARIQTIVLSCGSFLMYATEGLPFLLLLIASSALTATCSFLAGTIGRAYARAAMIAGITINLGVLVIFKYKGLMLTASEPPDASWMGDLLALGLPIGISFYTFHGISLVVDAWRSPDVLRHRQSFAWHSLDTALYLSFFPQLVAGPITKGKMFFPQIVAKRLTDVPWADALSKIIVGMFLKRVVADNLNQLTFPLTDPRTYPGTAQSELLAMIIGYSAQIFADFAGYSLIAIGVAMLFGYRLPDNFNQPYLAQSITDFWRRWHMSLSAWLRDYLYIPLGGNRRGRARTYVNLLIVMGLGGLWHGASWKFAVWGLWHGSLLAMERALGVGEPGRGFLGVLVAPIRVALTFCLVTLGWLLFRLEHLGDVILLAQEFMKPWRGLQAAPDPTAAKNLIYTLSAIVLLFHLPLRALRSYDMIDALIGWVRPFVLGSLCAIILMASGSRHAFIYFQF